MVRTLSALAMQGPPPDLSIVLDLPVSAARARRGQRSGAEDSSTLSPLTSRSVCAKRYLEVARTDAHGRVIDGNQPAPGGPPATPPLPWIVLVVFRRTSLSPASRERSNISPGRVAGIEAPDTAPLLVRRDNFAAARSRTLVKLVRQARRVGGLAVVTPVCPPTRGLGWDAQSFSERRVLPSECGTPRSVHPWSHSSSSHGLWCGSVG